MRKRFLSLSKHLVLTMILILPSLEAESQWFRSNPRDSYPWMEPLSFPDKSLGLTLQSEFKQHTIACSFNLPQEVTLNKSFLPKNINLFLTSDKLTRTVSQISGNASFLLLLPFSKTDTTKSLESFQNLTSADLITGSSSLIPARFLIEKDNSNFYFSQDCSGFLEAAVQASGRIKIPATLQTKIETMMQTRSQQDSKILAIEGIFVSPLERIFSAPSYDEFSNELFAKTWNYYSNNGSDTLIFYLKKLPGVFLTRSLTTEAERSVTLNGNVNVGAMSASLVSNINTSFSKSTVFDGVSWSAYIYNTGYQRNSLFKPFPLPHKILEYFNALSVTIKASGILPKFSQGVNHKIEFTEIPGIPTNYINNVQWSLSIKGANTVYSGTPNLSVSRGPKGGCVFQITGKPSPSLFNGNEGYVDVTYIISSNDKVMGKGLKFELSTTINTTKDPQIDIVRNSIKQSLPLVSDKPGYVRRTWELKIKLIGTNISYGRQFDLRDISFSKGPEKITLDVVSIVPDQGKKELSIILTENIERKGSEIDQNFTQQDFQLIGNLSIPVGAINDTDTALRNLTLNIPVTILAPPIVNE